MSKIGGFNVDELSTVCLEWLRQGWGKSGTQSIREGNLGFRARFGLGFFRKQ